MSENVFIPLGLSAIGVMVAFVASLMGRSRKDAAQRRDEVVSHRAEGDSDASRRMSFLMMHNGSYPLGQVELEARQPDF